MSNAMRLVRALIADRRGTAVIETAIIAPVLLLFSLGAFQISGIVARQSELQSAADIAAGVALSAKPDTAAELVTLKQVIMASTDLESSNVDLSLVYRCGVSAQFVASSALCGTSVHSTHVKIALTDTYVPYWSKIGLGAPLHFGVTRQAIVGQSS